MKYDELIEKLMDTCSSLGKAKSEINFLENKIKKFVELSGLSEQQIEDEVIGDQINASIE
jgi:hypothetical protein|tara:strand:+ start:2365 stop:2544 length:180 start_codon:yes stop_codon:yes gene_type:complete